jgi:hypothetical protein
VASSNINYLVYKVCRPTIGLFFGPPFSPVIVPVFSASVVQNNDHAQLLSNEMDNPAPLRSEGELVSNAVVIEEQNA